MSLVYSVSFWYLFFVSQISYASLTQSLPPKIRLVVEADQTAAFLQYDYDLAVLHNVTLIYVTA